MLMDDHSCFVHRIPERRGCPLTIPELRRILSGGESQTVEFKSWIHAGDARKRTQLAVKELVAFANARGGTLFFGVEDDGSVT